MKKIFYLSRSVFDKAKILNDLDILKNEQLQDGFYLNQPRVLEVGKKIKHLENKLALLAKLETLLSDAWGYVELSEEVKDGSLDSEVEDSLHILEREVGDAKIQTLLSGKYDGNDAIITIHAGAGGTEAQDWADMLNRMYKMYCEKHSYSIKILDVLPGDEAGLKGITFEVSGDNAYGFLKAEKGVHRLVRISPFDSNARRHTSFASVEVMPKIEEKPNIEIRPEELKIDTYRSSGAGGQNVNKTESAVRITHIPTGIVVACQVERSQVQNKETCMQMLYSKLVEKEEAEEMERLASIRGEIKKIEWGSQIRSYVFCPYTLVKDHRTGFEDSNVSAVMDGNIQEFINEYLKKLY
ncbi:MAG: peptide chain release factor 2 [Clostridiales bacterium]|nr:peptide chain release factor 2 [Clostridiales bacterium]